MNKGETKALYRKNIEEKLPIIEKEKGKGKNKKIGWN